MDQPLTYIFRHRASSPISMINGLLQPSNVKDFCYCADWLINADGEQWSIILQETVCTLARGRAMMQECWTDSQIGSLEDLRREHKALVAYFFEDLEWCRLQMQKQGLLPKPSIRKALGTVLKGLVKWVIIACQSAKPQGRAFKILPKALDLDDFKDKVVLDEEIGRGSQGVVVKGSWLQDPVAVKIIPVSLFLTEADVLVKIKHPNVVDMKGYIKRSNLKSYITNASEGWLSSDRTITSERWLSSDRKITSEVSPSYVLTHGSESTYCGLVMEFMSTTLESLIQNGEASSSELQWIDILLQVARGMQFLHHNGIMHRDLKPGNVLINPIHELPNGAYQLSYVVAKLADFGLTKFSKPPSGSKNQEWISTAGTTFYMAPEVRAHNLSVDERADVFSFGSTCFNVASRTWFEHVNRDAFYEMIKQGNVQSLLDKCKSSSLAKLIKVCWSYHPRSRPSFTNICESLVGMKRKLLLQRMPQREVAPKEGLKSKLYPYGGLRGQEEDLSTNL